MFVDFGRPEDIVNLGLVDVDLVLGACHVDVVDVFGGEEVLLHLELLVKG